MVRHLRLVTKQVLSTIYSTDRGYLRVYERSPVDDHVRAGVVSAAFVRLQQPHLFPGQSVHLSDDGAPALLIGHASTMSLGPRQAPHIAAATVAQIADGLAALHAERILHLDIHVAAVSMLTMMIDEVSNVALLDSEIARHLDLAPAPGDLAAPHRAPELASGKVDVRSDIYGLGVLLHQLLLGDAPIVRPIKDTPLGRTLARMLDPDPAKRPSTIDDVLEELAVFGYRQKRVAPQRRPATRYCRIVVLAPEPAEIWPAFIVQRPSDTLRMQTVDGTTEDDESSSSSDALGDVTSRWIADVCEIALRADNVYVTERPLGATETAGSSDDQSAALSLGDVVRVGDLVFVLTSGESSFLDTSQPRAGSITQRRCNRCNAMVEVHYRFCLHCGHDMQTNVPALLPPPPGLPPPPPPQANLHVAVSQLEPILGVAELHGRVGNWNVVRLLGAGGLASVFEVEHVVTGVRAALKTLRYPEYELAVSRFIAEARLLARLRHPNIVQLLDLGRDGRDRPFMLLELLEGMTLSELLQREPHLDYGRLLAFARQMASALGVMHALGIVHRDLSISNIFYIPGATPRFVIVDFGIATLPLEPDDDEEDGMLRGTPLYMAPEQVQGLPMSERTDLFALGVLLYELASGDNPFRDAPDIMHTIVRILQLDPPPLERDDLPAAFRELVMRLLRKHPDDRPPNATAVLEVLAQLPEA